MSEEEFELVHSTRLALLQLAAKLTGEGDGMAGGAAAAGYAALTALKLEKPGGRPQMRVG